MCSLHVPQQNLTTMTPVTETAFYGWEIEHASGIFCPFQTLREFPGLNYFRTSCLLAIGKPVKGTVTEFCGYLRLACLKPGPNDQSLQKVTFPTKSLKKKSRSLVPSRSTISQHCGTED